MSLPRVVVGGGAVMGAGLKERREIRGGVESKEGAEPE